MTSPLRAPASPPPTPPIGPSAEEWRAMSPAQREAFLLKVIDALSDISIVMSEGRPHKKAKVRAVDMLDLHFKKMGRVVYVAEDMAVVYPGKESFSPDVLAVLDVPQPEDDQRMAWVVEDEGKGLDFVLEVLDRGDRRKDLVENVERYADLGIQEYFVYDRAQQRILGYRLRGRDAGRYDRIVPQAGRYGSIVLGLDLAIQGGRLRFFQGMAELFGSEDLIGRLSTMVESLEVKANEAVAKANEAEAKANEAEAKANEAAVKANEAEARADHAVAGLRASVLAALETRGIPCPDEIRARVAACEDPTVLQGWLFRALSAASAAEVVSAASAR